jgi:hypothetical protein
MRAVVLVIDAKRLVGLNGQQIGAYVALRSMADVNDVDIATPTMANMFSLQQLAKPVPDDLTFWDRAYLGALYKTESEPNLQLQQSAMAARIVHAVKSQTILTKAGQ